MLAAATALAVAPQAIADLQASAAPTTLYAATAGAGNQTCATPAEACTLPTALTKVAAGGTIDLITVGNPSDASTWYEGPFTVRTPNTTSSAPVTIDGPSGGAILDGDGETDVLSNGADILVIDAVTVQDGGEGTAALTNDLGGSVTVSNSTFTQDYGGAIENGNVFLEGGVGGGTVTVVDDSFESNAASQGGAIDNVDGTANVSGSLFSGDSATYGGAIANAVGEGTSHPVHANLSVSSSYFTEDTSGNDGGAIDNGDSGGHGSATLTDDTLYYGISAAFDGGIIANGVNAGSGTMTVEESSFSEGSAGRNGGAIVNGANSGHGTMTVLHSTFFGDSAESSGPTIYNGYVGTGTISAGADVFGDPCTNGAAGTWHDLGYNVADDGTCLRSGTGDVVGGAAIDANTVMGVQYDPNLFVAEPLSGDPAIGVIPVKGTSFCPVAADERGIPSPNATPCDAGSVQDPPGAIVHLSAAPLPAKPGAVTYTVRIQGFDGLVPDYPVEISDGKGGSCGTGELSATSNPVVNEGSCSISPESVGKAPYRVTATFDGEDAPYGLSVASIEQTANVANKKGSVSAGSNDVTVKASGGTPGKDTLTHSDEPVNPNAVALPDGTAYFDVATSKGATFKHVVIDDCNGVTRSGDLEWWSTARAQSSGGDGWGKVRAPSKLTRMGKQECDVVTLSTKTSPSVAQLGGTSFATQTHPLLVSAGSLLVKDRVRRFGRTLLHASGGNAPYTWILSTGALPKGVKLSKSGVLSGTPTVKGTFIFTASVSDTRTSTYPGQRVQTTVTVDVT